MVDGELSNMTPGSSYAKLVLANHHTTKPPTGVAWSYTQSMMEEAKGVFFSSSLNANWSAPAALNVCFFAVIYIACLC